MSLIAMQPPAIRKAGELVQLLAWGAAMLTGCSDEHPLIDPVPEPRVTASSVAANPNNVLSAVITAEVADAESVTVRYGVGNGPLDSVTPALQHPGRPVVLPVLGLLPATQYQMQVVAHIGPEAGAGELLSFTTGDLPGDLPSYLASGSSPSPGFVLFAVGSYGIIIDNTGRIVWYRRLPGPTLNIQAQPNRRYTTSPIVTDSANPEPWEEYDIVGNLTRTLGCAHGLRPRFHDLLATPDGSFWLMCDETRMMDLTAIGGASAAAVTGTVIQHLGPDRSVLFEWNAFDHFSLLDVDSFSRSGATVNWTHGNAIDLDPDGNLLASFRSLSEVTKIDGATGAVIWRMGGLANQFTFPNAAMPFSRQHGLRFIGPGTFQLLDNMGEPTGSRAERYTFDDATRTASLVASFSSAPAVTAQLGGATQYLSGNRTLVAYGNGFRVQEYDGVGQVVWEIQGSPGYIFRAQRILSLYSPGVGTAR
jgi:hypothetical protein